MRLLVCGGRDFANEEMFEVNMNRLDEDRKITCIIEGGATGADTMAREWAERNGRNREQYPMGPGGGLAGPIRNRAMLDKGKPDKVLAFPGGRGTMDMVGQARWFGVPVEYARRIT